jgi:ornithine carbamoyltransferase
LNNCTFKHIDLGILMSFLHFLADDQCSQEHLLALIALAQKIKHSPAYFSQALAGKSIVMLFEKPSLRTHVSFDIGIAKLGGHALYLGQQNGKLGERERVSDYAKNLSCYADAIVARVFNHQTIAQLAEHANVPVINALCDLYHPCQALADFVTLSENLSVLGKTRLSEIKLAYIGDANNVSNSLMLMAAILGVDFTLICPEQNRPNTRLYQKAEKFAEKSGGKLKLSHTIGSLAQQDVIYTDTWVSMGSKTKVDDVLAKFSPYQVNHQLMNAVSAKQVMHCQPAHLGEEITTELFDDENKSVVFQQAENRMWAQNAILVTLLAPNYK